jgi:hypothetical protein
LRERWQQSSGGSSGGNGDSNSSSRLRLQPVITLEAVLAAGRDLAREQQAVMDVRLAKQVR